MMRSIFAAAFVLMMVFPVYGHAESARFFESIQDLPLMPGLVERAEETVAFDKPGGRIIESVAEIQGVSDVSVAEYYAVSLPQFGWQAHGGNRFVRQDEALELAFEERNGTDIVRVMLRPR